MKKLTGISLIYMYLPIFTFLLLWLNPWLGILLSVLGAAALLAGYRSIVQRIDESKDVITITPLHVLIIFAFFMGLGIFCGGGNPFFYQDHDWSKHTAILNDLTYYQWPVVYQNDAMLTYYLGQYIVPGFIGKVFHSLLAAKWAETVWNAIGYTLIYFYIVQLTEAQNYIKQFFILVFMVFFSGAQLLASYFYQFTVPYEAKLFAYKWIDMGAFRVHFASNFDAMRGAFQHVVIPWLATAMFLYQKRNVSVYAVLALPMMFAATFGFVYFAWILAAYLIVEIYRTRKEAVKQVFSFQNIAVLVLAIIFLIYLMGNFAGEKPGSVGFSVIDYSNNKIFYILFVAAEFVVYLLCLLKNRYKDPLYWIITIQLFVIPFLSLGLYNDLCSRGGIPARFIMMIYLMQQIYDEKTRKSFVNLIVAITFAIGMINVVDECLGVLYVAVVTRFKPELNEVSEFGTLEGMAGNEEIHADEAYNYYTLNYEDSLFYKISRH